MGKRQRTPRFVTPGLGDGHVGRDNSQQEGQKGSHAQIGYHHNAATLSDAKVHNPANTDDIFHTSIARRNNPNHPRLRPARDERRVRMEMMDEGKESRWGAMFGGSSTSGDANGKIESRLVSNMHDQLQQALTLVLVIVFISALFLHLVSSDSSSGSSSSAHTHHHRSTPKPRGFHSKSKRKSSGGATRKKKTDEWISDESASEEEEGMYRGDSDGQASANTGTPKKGGIPGAGSTNNKNLFYPYQPRHRKPSAGGKSETYGATYSPLTAAKSEAIGFQSRNYYLTPGHGPVMTPSYQSPSSGTHKGRLVSPAYVPPPQHIPGATVNNKEQIQGGVSGVASADIPRSPNQSQHVLAKESFVATGLESFQAEPPSMDAPPVDIDEESQHRISESSGHISTPTNNRMYQSPKAAKIVHQSSAIQSPAMIQMQSPSPDNRHSGALPKCQLSYTQNNNNSYTAYGSVCSNDFLQTSTQQQKSTPSRGGGSGSGQLQFNTSTSNHSSLGMLSPRVDMDIADLETPRAGMQRRTVDVSINNGQGVANAGSNGYLKQGFNNAGSNLQGGAHQMRPGSSNGSNNPEDPFQILRLPSTTSMGASLQGVCESGIQPDQQDLGFSMPLLPNLEPSPAAARHGASAVQASLPHAVSVEELRLVEMESGSAPHWHVRNASEHKSPTTSSAAPALGISTHLFDGVPSAGTDDDSDEFVDTNSARPQIVHKRTKITDDTDAASSLKSSIKFDELNLIEVIGGGGFGQVWKAFWRGTPVAVKVLTGSAQARHVSKVILEEFAAEINLLSGMGHPNIILYMGACVDPPNRAIITELAANGSLWDALRLPLNPPFQACDGFSRHFWPDVLYNGGKHGAPPMSTAPSLPPVPPVGTWPWILVKHVAFGTARALGYLHSGNPPILHRDLKSANILLNESYSAKVCDFGLSRLKAQERSMTGNCGTVQWMAPEVLANQRYAESADVYSFGIICTELLTRECPFDGMSAIQCALAVLNRDQRPEIPKWCPPQLKALIKGCVKKNPNERPTFSQIIAALGSMP